MKINNRGLIINEAGKKKIQPDFRPLVEDIKKQCLLRFRDVKSIYLRGSVSEGKAKKFISDVDMVVLLKRKPSPEEIIWNAKFMEGVEEKYPFVTEVDLTLIPFDELVNSQDYKRLRICLKTQSCLLYGEEILDRLPKIKAGRDLALELYGDIEYELNDLMRIFLKSEKRSYLARKRSNSFWCRWTMRTILRSALGLVMMKKKIYSNDLQVCLREFIRFYPEHKRDIQKVMKWELNPICDNKKILKFLDYYIPKYVLLWKEYIK